MTVPTGVVFPTVDQRRSTSAAGRTIVAAALRAADPIGAGAAMRETDWRHGYLTHFRRLVEAGLDDAEQAREIARVGVQAVHDTMRWADAHGEERDLAAAADADARSLDTEIVTGTGDPETELTIPYRGRRLGGDQLRHQLDVWVEAGTIEPSAREAVGLVVANPDWLRLQGRTLAVLGAAAEMAPVRSLLRWGATVAAIDLARPAVWERIVSDARASAGPLLVPVRAGNEALTRRAGADLITEPAAVARWLTSLPGPIVIGNYVYADGSLNVQVSTAVDLITQATRQARSDAALAFLATPTDIFAVPAHDVAASVEQYASRRVSKLVRVPLRTISGGRLLQRNYQPGADPGVNDSVVVQQGPNYLLAKRIQRWRATTARAEGTVVSLKVAPPTRTRSVLKNRALAAAYAGAHRFGIEVFEPDTSTALMAALLVHDLHTGSPAQPHPWQDEAAGAVHGGLWTCAYDPRSALGLAVLLGAVSVR